MLKAILLILFGFLFLVKGADFLVDGASEIAKKFHISEIIIGLTIISFGTTMPELFVSTTSALGGHTDMAIGNAIGSIISNLLLILGLSSVLQSIDLKKQTRFIDVPISIVIAIIFMFMCNTENFISRTEGIIFIVMLALFVTYTIVMAIKGKKFNDEDDENNKQQSEENADSTKNYNVFKSILKVLLGIVALKFGGDFTVNNAVIVAEYFGLSEKIIGVTILAVGTSLPELVTCVSAAIKKKSDIAIGNVLGANILNILLIVGVSAIIKPMSYNISYNKDLIIIIIATTLLEIFAFIPPTKKMSRFNGLTYLDIYIGYMINLFMNQ